MELLKGISKVDFYWSDNGDFTIENGDIKDTNRTNGAGFLEEVSLRLKSSVGDWKFAPDEGASLSTFEGETNNSATWNRIYESILYSLTYDLFVYPDSVQINIAPIDSSEIAIRVDFTADLDILLGTELPSVKFVYNLSTNQSYIMR